MAVDGLRTKLAQLRAVEESFSKDGLHLIQLADHLTSAETLLSRTESAVEAEDYDEVLSPLQEMNRELDEFLSIASSASNLVEVRRSLLAPLGQLDAVRADADLKEETDVFDLVVSEARREAVAVMGEKHISKTGELLALSEKAERAQEIVKMGGRLCELVKKLGEIPEFIEKERRAKLMAEVRAILLLERSPFADRMQEAVGTIEAEIAGVRELEEIARDLERLYPMWKRTVLPLIRERGNLSLSEMVSVPEKWRAWFAERISMEESLVFSGKKLLVGKPPAARRPLRRPAEGVLEKEGPTKETVEPKKALKKSEEI